ncbi:FeoA family protein [Sphingomicrobium sp. XHP0239]|uniref:FeoA family protein n=1 Tax=Sphingomicrobium maritimum TaxID=3133972 RepID=UPI0031CC88C9
MLKTTTRTRSLDVLETQVSGEIMSIDWDSLPARDASRLRNFGFDEGVMVTALHRAPFGADPVAVRVGRMTVAIRRAHAAAVQVALPAA